MRKKYLSVISSSGIYYKGAGTIYICHFSNEPEIDEKLLSKTGIIYEQNKVCYSRLLGKYGIFKFPHQPMFSDLEGGCGAKEKNLLKMQKEFQLSAIEEIVDVIPTGILNHNIYAYRLKEHQGSLRETAELIEYVLTNDYCTAWDKNLWADIYSYKYVRDVGDWFVSDQLGCKIGTVYAMLHSLYESDIYIYCSLLNNLLGVYNCERHFIIYYSALIVRKYFPDMFEQKKIELDNITPELFGQILREMFMGKACCHLENDDKWVWVRAYFLSKEKDYIDRIGHTIEFVLHQ